MADSTQPPPNYFRDIRQGDSGADVTKAQQLLGGLGYDVSEDEKRRGYFGATTQKAKNELEQNLQNGGFLQLLGLFLRLMLSGDKGALDSLIGTSFEDISDNRRANLPLIGGMGRALPVSRTEQLQIRALDHLCDNLQGATAGERTANLVHKFIGQHEVGDNGGAIVDLCNGYSGDPWCGGFTHYILNKTMPGVYTQENFRAARSYMEVGQQYHAFHRPGDGYVPQAGDPIVFSRGSDKGHVGIVVSYDQGTGQLIYAAGNDGNCVREHAIDMRQPPERLLGFTDSHEIARAKGIALDRAAPVKNGDHHVDNAHLGHMPSQPLPKQSHGKGPAVHI